MVKINKSITLKGVKEMANSYEEAAPNISKVVNETTFKNDFPEETPYSNPLPEMTNTKILACYTLLKDVVGNGGLPRIAQASGLATVQAKLLHAEVQAAKSFVYK